MVRRGPKPIPMDSRFWRFVCKSSGCWEWAGCKSPEGYGKICGSIRSKPEPAHRLSWEIHFGEIPNGFYVCHSCDNPGCVNPDHLFLGTHADNMTDKVHKGRHHTRRLKKEDAKYIRQSVHTLGYHTLARKYHVSQVTIHDIATGKTWKNV